MIQKNKEKQIAIKLRKQGKTYSEILEVVTVAKSTLSIWLKEVGMAKSQKQRFTLAKQMASKRGGEAKRKQRIERQRKIFLEAKSKIKSISKYNFFLLGVCLYWAEGTKEKDYHPGSGIAFSNMDPKMIVLFLRWLEKVCKIPKDMLIFEITVHESHKERLDELRKYWSSVTGFPIGNFNKIYFKRNKIKKINRKNIGEKYYGVLKIKVRKSSSLVRKIFSWSESIFKEVLKIK